MEMFALEDNILALEPMLKKTDGPARLCLLVTLAWHLRQRDLPRAGQLCQEAEALAANLTEHNPDHQRMLARLRLIGAEAEWLQGRLGEAEASARAALKAFAAIGDKTGGGDAHWLLVSILDDRGEFGKVDQHLDATCQLYRHDGDLTRKQLAHARKIAFEAFGDPHAAAAALATAFPTYAEGHEAVRTWVAVAHANVAALSDNPGAAIKHDLVAHQAALASGQIRQAHVCAANISEGFAALGDLDAAVEWGENAVSMARSTHWPGSTGVCLMQLGDVLRQLERFDSARTLLEEALSSMPMLNGSRNFDNVLGAVGQLTLDQGDAQAALGWFQKLHANVVVRAEPDLLMKAHCGQASALSRLGQPDAAFEQATTALNLARAVGNADEQLRALRVFAELYRDHGPALPGADGAAELGYLEEAMRIAEGMEGFAVPPDLLQQMAEAYAGAGHFKAAYQASRDALQARNNSRSAEANKRALALQIRSEISQVKAETEHHRQMAATLKETLSTLETLGLIGREITANLEMQAVFAALHKHVDQLLDAHSFAIYLLDPRTEVLSIAFGIENGLPHPPNSVPLGHPSAQTARCARERREIVIDKSDLLTSVTIVPGSLATQSMLFAPLETSHRLLGVITIQSLRPFAYRERETLIFRTLCAYAAIGIDNAMAYTAVEQARQQAASQEQELRVAAVAFESQEGMLITDADWKTLRVNTAFFKITGYRAHEVIDQRPVIFRPTGQHTISPETIEETARATGNWQGEFWARRKSGDVFPLWITITGVRTERGTITHFVFTLTDITERKLAEDEIRNLAFFDPLTGLPNRRLLMDRLRQFLAKRERDGRGGALLFIDLDNFKSLNDTRGHDIGDLLLKQVAARLREGLREGDTVARLGGDEFVILLEGLKQDVFGAAEHVENVAEKMLESLNQPYELGGQTHHTTPSIGVSVICGHRITAEDLLKQADVAMYQAKAAGRNAIRFFDPSMQAAVAAHAALEADLRLALQGRQFTLYYQPQVDLEGRVIGAEALVRWQHPLRGMVAPNAFIPLAEETGLILPLGQWVLETACQQLQQWAARPETAALTLAVNISARQFHDPAFVPQITRLLAASGIVPQRLKLELTESLLLKDVDSVIDKMNALRQTGVSFSLDDFGTGYSSLSYLKRLPFSQLKIDQSFVRDLFEDDNGLAIVRAIVTLGHILGLNVIAEGVETEEQRAFLEASGCQAYQGYLFGRPVPAERFGA